MISGDLEILPQSYIPAAQMHTKHNPAWVFFKKFISRMLAANVQDCGHKGIAIPGHAPIYLRYCPTSGANGVEA